MHRRPSLLIALAGLVGSACAFDPGGLGGGGGPKDAAIADAALPDVSAPDASPPDASPPDAAPPDAPDAGPPFCEARADLVACYRFEQAAQSLQPFDESMYANHGTAMNVAFPIARGSQVLLTGLGSEVRVPDSGSLSPAAAITIELFMRPDELPMTGRAGLLDDDGQYGLFLEPTGSLRCTTAVAAVNTPAGTFTAGAWHHVACSYDGAMIRLYVDGVMRVAGPGTGLLGTGSTIGMAIGHNAPTGDNFVGAIDGLRIWSSARSASEICLASGSVGC